MNNTIRHTIKLVTLCSIMVASHLNAQDLVKKEQSPSPLEWSLHIGVNIGATTPVPLPAEIRKLTAYDPKFNPSLGVSVAYKLKERWHIGTGLTLEWKGMKVHDEVKYMYTSVVLEQGGEPLTGYFVGKNYTNANMSYLTLPVYVSYQASKRWEVHTGIYAAKLLTKEFSGEVSDGYLRIGTTTGEKQFIDAASFDFSDNINDYDFGCTAGAEYRLNSHIACNMNLNWALSPYFSNEENPISFKMYNVYTNIGLNYRL